MTAKQVADGGTSWDGVAALVDGVAGDLDTLRGLLRTFEPTAALDEAMNEIGEVKVRLGSVIGLFRSAKKAEGRK